MDGFSGRLDSESPYYGIRVRKVGKVLKTFGDVDGLAGRCPLRIATSLHTEETDLAVRQTDSKSIAALQVERQIVQAAHELSEIENRRIVGILFYLWKHKHHLVTYGLVDQGVAASEDIYDASQKGFQIRCDLRGCLPAHRASKPS